MEISRGMHDITFEGVRTCLQRRPGANELLAKAADALGREESTAFDQEVQEELDMLQLNMDTTRTDRKLSSGRFRLVRVVPDVLEWIRRIGCP